MARPRKNFIDTDRILLKIFELTIQRQKEIDAELKRLRDIEDRTYHDAFQRLMKERRRCDWTPYDVSLLADRALSSAERRAWQRKILELEKSNHIEVRGVRGADLRLKRKGKERVRDVQHVDKQ